MTDTMNTSSFQYVHSIDWDADAFNFLHSRIETVTLRTEMRMRFGKNMQFRIFHSGSWISGQIEWGLILVPHPSVVCGVLTSTHKVNEQRHKKTSTKNEKCDTKNQEWNPNPNPQSQDPKSRDQEARR